MKEIFDLPFMPEGEIKIMQGFHGPWSHKEVSVGRDSTFAVDFIVPLGTPVFAARDGEVAMVYDLSSDYYRGNNPEIGNKLHFGVTNFIFIEHEGGIVSVYSHLEKGSSLVDLRRKVKAGQQIAKTGLSGWVGPNPHLHFQLFSRDNYKSLPFELNGYNRPLEHSQLNLHKVA